MLSGPLSVGLAGLVGYIVGATPTGYLIARGRAGVDVRMAGSGHTGGSNVARVAGLGAGVATAVVDALLGVAAVALSGMLSDNPWAATAAGTMAVVGHDWSALIGFDGGIGLTTLGGTLLWYWPLRGGGVDAAMILVWLLLVRLVGIHRTRATILALALAGPALYLAGAPVQAVALGMLGGVAAIVKSLPDWNREHE